MVVDRVGHAVYGGPGPEFAGLHHLAAGQAGAARAALTDVQARLPARLRQADVRLRRAVGVSIILAVADHLVRQYAVGNQVVSDAPQGRLAIFRDGVDLRPLCLSLRSAALAQSQAAWTKADPHCPADHVHAHGGSVLADRAQLL